MTDETTIAPEVPAPAAEETKETKAANRLTREQWVEIEAHWEYGTKTAVELSELYKISPTSLSQHFTRHKIKRGSKKHMLKAAAEIKVAGAVAASEDSVAVSFEQQRRGRIARTRESLYSLSAINAHRAATVIREWQDGTRTPAACNNDLKALRHMELLIKQNIENRFKVLKADDEIDEANLPTLIFRDLSEEEIQAIAAGGDDDEIDLDVPEDAKLEGDEEDEVIEES